MLYQYNKSKDWNDWCVAGLKAYFPVCFSINDIATDYVLVSMHFASLFFAFDNGNRRVYVSFRALELFQWMRYLSLDPIRDALGNLSAQYCIF
jgi:hypothetical protein